MANPISYLDQLLGLLPRGRAWNKSEGSNNWKLMNGLSKELARVDGKAKQLLTEIDPRESRERLPDWERLMGLPDDTTPSGNLTMAERQSQVATKMVGTGGASIPYFKALASALGYDIEIVTFPMFRAGVSHAGDSVNGYGWRFYFKVKSKNVTVRRFSAGKSAAGESLTTWGDEFFERIIRKRKPAHTEVIFTYGG